MVGKSFSGARRPGKFYGRFRLEKLNFEEFMLARLVVMNITDGQLPPTAAWRSAEFPRITRKLILIVKYTNGTFGYWDQKLDVT